MWVMHKGPFQNESGVGSLLDVKLQATPWFGKRHRKSCQHLPGGGKGWQEETGGSMLWGQQDKTTPRQHIWWPASTCTATGTFLQFPWVAKRFFGACSVSWGHTVTTISSFLSITASPVSPCDALNLWMFHDQALKSAPLRHLQEHLQVHLFVKL